MYFLQFPLKKFSANFLTFFSDQSHVWGHKFAYISVFSNRTFWHQTTQNWCQERKKSKKDVMFHVNIGSGSGVIWEKPRGRNKPRRRSRVNRRPAVRRSADSVSIWLIWPGDTAHTREAPVTAATSRSTVTTRLTDTPYGKSYGSVKSQSNFRKKLRSKIFCLSSF